MQTHELNTEVRHTQFSSQFSRKLAQIQGEVRMFLYCELCFKWVFFAFFQTLLLNTEVNICNFLYKFLTKMRKFKHKLWKTHVFGKLICLLLKSKSAIPFTFSHKIAQIQAEILKNARFLHCRLCFHSAFFDLLQYKLKTEVDICNFLHNFAQIQAEILKNACFLQWKCALTKHFSLFCKSVECWSRHPQFFNILRIGTIAADFH